MVIVPSDPGQEWDSLTDPRDIIARLKNLVDEINAAGGVSQIKEDHPLAKEFEVLAEKLKQLKDEDIEGMEEEIKKIWDDFKPDQES